MADDYEVLYTARGELRMSAYYFDFEPTGVEAIDRILAAVCKAGKGYHSTDGWNEPLFGEPEDGKTYIDLIQQMANEAALALRAKDGEPS